MPTIEYSPLIEKDVKAILEPIVERYSWLLPGWLHKLHVNYMLPDPGGDESSAASTLTNKNYRYAIVCIGTTFFLNSEQERRRVMVHELLHLSLSNAMDYASRTFADLDKDGALAAHAERELNSQHEQGIQDIAYAIVQAEAAGKQWRKSKP